jgi:chemotaxis protein CheD
MNVHAVAADIGSDKRYEGNLPAVTHTIGISEMRVSNEPDDVLVTYSLGSCVGLTLYDPVVRVGGMIHCMLPMSEMFTDTGIPALIQGVLNLGAQESRLVAKVAGAASLLNDQSAFQIGERNYVALRKILAKRNIPLVAEDTGGTGARTLYLHMSTGKAIVKSRGEERELV